MRDVSKKKSTFAQARSWATKRGLFGAQAFLKYVILSVRRFGQAKELILSVFHHLGVGDIFPPPLAAVLCGQVRPTREHNQGCRWVLVHEVPFGRLEDD